MGKALKPFNAWAVVRHESPETAEVYRVRAVARDAAHIIRAFKHPVSVIPVVVSPRKKGKKP